MGPLLCMKLKGPDTGKIKVKRTAKPDICYSYTRTQTNYTSLEGKK